jgi:hypothetical protein
MNALENLLKALPTNPYGFATACALVLGAIILRVMNLWAWRKAVGDKMAFAQLAGGATSDNQKAMIAQSEPPPPPPTGIFIILLMGAAALSMLAGGVHHSLQMARRGPGLVVPMSDGGADLSDCPDCPKSAGCECKNNKCSCPTRSGKFEVPEPAQTKPASPQPGPASAPHSLASTIPWFSRAVDAWPEKPSQ